MLSYFRSFSTTNALFATAKKAASSTATGAAKPAAAKKPTGAKKAKAKKPAAPKPKTKTQLKLEEKPKRPAYPYLLYNKEKWHSVRDATDLKFTEIGKEMAKLWKAESPEVKAKFVSQYEAEREAYEKKMETWRAKWAKPLSGYIKFVIAENKARPTMASREEAIEQMKAVASKWNSLSASDKAEWKSK